MKKALIITLAATALVACSICSAETLQGKITEGGYGKFRMEDKDGTEILLNESRKTTQYEPAMWRPQKGDTISVEYHEKTSRNGALLVVDTATLEKAGPLTVNIESPVNAVVLETGRSGYIVILPDYKNMELKFARGRKTKVIPTGWTPEPREKVKITFTKELKRFGFGISYTANTVEKVTE